jgi:hypothetical protein
MPFSTLSESKKITKFCSTFFSTISNVKPIARAYTVKADAILAILNFHPIPPLTFFGANATNRLLSIFETFVAKHLLVLILPWRIF